MSGEELEKSGLPGPSQIRNLLSKTRKDTTFVNAIRKFQTDNGLRSSVMVPALKLLDAHGVRRADCYEQIICVTSEKLLEKLKILGDEKSPETQAQLSKQLSKCFKMYRIPQIRPIVLETLNQIYELPESYVEKIVADPSLYNDVSVRVKRQIWIRHEDLFVEAVKPVIAEYIEAKRCVLCSIDPSPTNFFSSETTKTRRQWKHVQLLVQMFGDYEVLYTKLMEMIREGFLQTADPLYCSLKQEIIMAGHESGNESGSKNNPSLSDPAHELSWCLDMCLRDKHIDVIQANRLRNTLEGLKKQTEVVIGDISMVAADPHVIHFLCTMGIKLMRDSSGHLPREQGGFLLIVRLLYLGAMAHKIVQTQTVPAQMVEAIFFTKFLPSMASLISEDLMRVELAKYDRQDEAEALGLYSPPSDTISTFLKSEPAAALLWIHYTVDLLPRRNLDIKGMLRYLRLLPILRDQLSTRSPWSHLLVHRLLTSPLVETLVNDAEVVGIIIDRLFLASLKVDVYVKYQLLRIISQAHRVIHPSISAAIMEHVLPSTIGECIDSDKYAADYARTMHKMIPKEEEPVVVVPRVYPTAPLVQATPARIQSTPSHSFDY